MKKISEESSSPQIKHNPKFPTPSNLENHSQVKEEDFLNTKTRSTMIPFQVKQTENLRLPGTNNQLRHQDESFETFGKEDQIDLTNDFEYAKGMQISSNGAEHNCVWPLIFSKFLEFFIHHHQAVH